jgi:hypothetical protein
LYAAKKNCWVAEDSTPVPRFLPAGSYLSVVSGSDQPILYDASLVALS